MNVNPENVFKKVADVVFIAILIAMTIAMAIGTVKLFGNIWQMLTEPGVTGKYLDMITDVLTLFVLVELSKSLVDYFQANRLRMTFIVDAAIVFFIREIMIMVFQHKVSTEQIYAFSVLLLVLSVLRIGSIFMFQRERSIVEQVKDESLE